LLKKSTVQTTGYNAEKSTSVQAKGTNFQMYRRYRYKDGTGTKTYRSTIVLVTAHLWLRMWGIRKNV